MLKRKTKGCIALASTFITLMATTSCHRVNISAEAPDKLPVTATYAPKLSTINVPVTFQIGQVEAKLNQELSQVLYKDDNLEGDNVKVTITRNGPLSLKADNNKLYFSIPLHVWAQGSWTWKACSFCPSLGKTESTQFNLTVNTESRLGLTEDWKVKTKTSGSYTWGDKRPFLEIGPIRIPLSGIIDMALQPQMGKLTDRLDEEVQNRVSVKEYVQKAWNDVQKPFLLDKNLNAWLVVTPKEIRISPMELKEGKADIRVGIKSLMEVVTGSQPQVKVNNDLPKLIMDNNIQDNFQIGLSADVPYTLATQMIKNETKGKIYSFEDGKYQLEVLDADLTGNGNKLTLQMDVRGKVRKGSKKNIGGRIYMEGVPYYDLISSSVKVRDFDFDVKTKNVLLKSASWLASAGFQKQIQDKLVFPMKDQLSQAQKAVQQGLDQNSRLTENVLMKGNITDLKPEGIFLTSNSIKAVVTAQGKISLLIDKL